MSPRSFAVVTVTLLLVGVLPAVALGGVSGGPEARASESLGEVKTLAPHDSSIEPGEVEMRIELAANGDAQWRVMTAVSVRDEDDREAFDDLVKEFNGSDSPLGLNAFRESARNASRATGREMAIEGVERQHALHNETGTLWVTFTWTNFGNGTGDRLAVDDGFNTESGVWLPSLSEEETLVVVPPDGYGVSSAPTGTSSAPSSLANGIARWEGPQEFGQRGPWIVYSGDALVPTPTTTAGSGTGTSDGPTTGGAGPPGGGGDGLIGGFSLVVLVLIAGASAVVVGLYMRGDDDGLAAVVTDGTDDSGSSAASATDPTTSNTGTTAGSTNGSGTAVDESAANDRAATGSAAAGAGAAGAGAGTDGTGETSADDEIDEALLSDEERVERLIERNGGRMKQAAIVKETGWSNAKVSQLLSAMDDEGRIDKLRIGRENLISFPDEDVADLDSE